MLTQHVRSSHPNQLRSIKSRYWTYLCFLWSAALHIYLHVAINLLIREGMKSPSEDWGMRKWGMKEEWEGKSDGCDRQVSIACDARLEVDYSGPCGLQSIRVCGNEKMLDTDCIPHAHRCTNMHSRRYNSMQSHMQSTSHTRIVNRRRQNPWLLWSAGCRNEFGR